MNDRIKLAEAMGWKWDESIRPRKDFPDGWCCWIKPDGDKYFSFDAMPDPFLDANDDYAVLEWARETDYCVEGHPILELMANALHHLIVLRRDPTCNPENYGLNVDDVVMDIQVGDYARAVLKVLQ